MVGLCLAGLLSLHQSLGAWLRCVPQGSFPLPFSECLLCASAFAYSIPFNPHSHLQGEYHPHFVGEETGIERLGDLTQITQLLWVTSWGLHHHPSTKGSSLSPAFSQGNDSLLPSVKRGL